MLSVVPLWSGRGAGGVPALLPIGRRLGLGRKVAQDRNEDRGPQRLAAAMLSAEVPA
jgi:hypothetical protein